MTVEVHQAVQEGKESEALRVIKALCNSGLDYPGGTPSSKGLLVRDDSPAGLEVGDGYRDHLGRLFSQVKTVANSEARIRVRITT